MARLFCLGSVASLTGGALSFLLPASSSNASSLVVSPRAWSAAIKACTAAWMVFTPAASYFCLSAVRFVTITLSTGIVLNSLKQNVAGETHVKAVRYGRFRRSLPTRKARAVRDQQDRRN